jgi:hypothetical protein
MRCEESNFLQRKEQVSFKEGWAVKRAKDMHIDDDDE